MERSLRRRAITPQIRKRLNRRRRASAALTTLMVAGPAGQVLAATGAGSAPAPGGPAPAPATPALDTGAFGLMLKSGSTGAAVAAVQERLGVAADGVFGPVTEAAVRDFQLRNALDVDGVVGPITWTKLFGLDRAAVRAGAAEGQVAVIVRERPTDPGRAARGGGDGEAAEGRPGPRTVPAVGPAPRDTEPVAVRAPRELAPSPRAERPSAGACGGLRLASPVKGVLTSPYGPRWGRNHDGIDIAAPTGTAVRAAECGVVSARGAQGGYGNMVCVKHSDRLETCYAHLSRFAVSSGQTVRRGQVIGYVGCTGSCTGPHLHFETRVDGSARNPAAYLGGAAVPGRPAVARTAAAGAGGPERTSAARPSTPTRAAWQQPAAARAAAPEHVEDASSAQAQPAPPEAVPEAVEPAPAPVEPAPAAVGPAPKVVEPAPAAVGPAPEVVEPAPAAVEPAAEVVEPAPEAAEPAPLAVEPAPAVVEPAGAEPVEPVEPVELATDPVPPVVEPVEEPAGP